MKIGDKVKWVHWTVSGRSFSGRTKTGTIEAIAGDSARIGVRRGVFYWCLLNMVRPIDQPSALNDIVNEMTQPSPQPK